MAHYVADYQFDLGKTQLCLLLKSYLRDLNGDTRRTNYDFDAQVLPLTFQDYVLQKNEVKAYCTANFQPRRCHLYLSETTFLSVQLPFLPTSMNYLNFIAEAKANPDIKKIELVGERISNQYTLIWSNE